MASPWRRLRWFSAYVISRAGASLAFLPTRLWYAGANPVADACFALMRDKRHIAIQNLSRVVGPEKAEAAARRVFRNFARYIIDFYQLPSLGRDALCERIDFREWRRLNEALAEGNGVLFVTLHLGQAELGAAGLAAYGHPVNVIAETLSYRPMDNFIQGLRRKLGMKIITANKAKPGVLRCLSRGEVLGMMFDAVGPGEGVRVDFFGAAAEVSSAPARIALRTGARVLPAVISRDADDATKLIPAVDFDLRFDPSGGEEADVLALTQAIAHSFEGFVQRFPDQWFAFRPVWPAATDRPAADDGAGDEAWKRWSLQAAVALGGLLPRPVAYALARLAGDLAYAVRPNARSDVEDNMRHVLGADASPEAVRNAAREAFRNVARYYVDLVRLARGDSKQLFEKDLRVSGLERLTSRARAGQPVVATTAHFGNPEFTSVLITTHADIDIRVLLEPLPPAFARVMKRLRAAYGLPGLDVGFSGVAQGLRHLRAGKILCVVSDRDLQNTGAVLPFFGVLTRMPTGVAELAARTGADILPVFSPRRGDGFEVVFEEPVALVNTGRPKEDAITNTKALIVRLETWIRRDPGQWTVLERVWKPLTPEELTEAEASTSEETVRAGAAPS